MPDRAAAKGMLYLFYDDPGRSPQATTIFRFSIHFGVQVAGSRAARTDDERCG
jgi:hypothetical protein